MTPGARRFGRQGRLVFALAAVAMAAAATALAPAPPGLAGAEAGRAKAFAALAAAAIVAVAVIPILLSRVTRRRGLWAALAVSGLVLGIAAFSASGRIERRCTADYDGRPVVVGTELTPLGERYVAANPQLSRDELVFDAAGEVERIWTRGSIDRCRQQLAATYFLWIPLLTVCLTAAILAVPAGPLAAVPVAAGPGSRADRPASPARYDVFLSYRHGPPDADIARDLLETLEADGYRVAIDERDFPANASFLEEMERCIRESRYTVAIVSARYLESGNCQEEAIVCKVLDMDERRRRLVPIVIEPVSMPAWLYGIVGIFLTRADPLVEPLDKLRATLGPPQRAEERAEATDA